MTVLITLPPRTKDLTKQQFGRLLVLGYSHKVDKKIFWLCKCTCGKEVIRRSDSLKNLPKRVSCGCWVKEITKENNQKPEVKEKIRQKMLGRDAFWAKGNKNCLGRKVTDQEKAVLRESTKKQWAPEFREYMSTIMKDKIVSDETKVRISKTSRERGSQKGANNPAWKVGISPLTASIRACFKYNGWRFAIYNRDDSTCVLCGSKEKIQADHIVPFAKLLRDNNINSIAGAEDCVALWDVSNGRCLCYECHKATPTFGNKRV